MSMILPSAILKRVFEHVHSNGIVLKCMLVDSNWRNVARVVLYRVVLFEGKPPWFRTTEYVLPEQLDTAKLPGYNEQVRSVRVSGYNAPPLDFLDSFPFLHTISYLPLDLAPTGSSVLLASLARLENLELSSGLFTTDDSVGPLLDCSFEKLRNLTISSPNRALLNVLPLWIARLGRLRGLHLLDNCGSVTPGVLSSLLAAIVQSLDSFSLGISYSLRDSNVFDGLARFSHTLRELNLVYFLQLTTPRFISSFPLLEFLQIRYNDPQFTRTQRTHLSSWVRRIITDSPHLHSLHLLPSPPWYDESEPLGGATPKFDGLVDHLRTKHRKTLEVLKLRGLFVGVNALKALFGGSFGRLEVLEFRTKSLFLCQILASTSFSRIRTLRIDLTPHKRSRHRPTDDEVRGWMANGTSMLRSVCLIPKIRWEGEWGFGADFRFSAKRETRHQVNLEEETRQTEVEEDELQRYEKTRLGEILEEEE